LEKSSTRLFFSSRYSIVIIITEEAAHVDVLLFFLLLLFLLLLDSGSSGSGISGDCSTSATSGSNVRQKLSDVLSLEGLGEKGWPVWLNGVS
jgi:hypothetical protein